MRIGQFEIAMTDGHVAERHVIPVRDLSIDALIYGERDEVVRFTMKRSCRGVRHGRYHALQIGFAAVHMPVHGITNTIRSLGYRGLANIIIRITQDDGSSLRHS